MNTRAPFVTEAEMGENEDGPGGAANSTLALDPPSVLDYRKGDPW